MRGTAVLGLLAGIALLQPAGISPAPGVADSTANRSPYWPSPRTTKTSTQFKYDDYGELVGAVTKITIVTKPIDPDRDRLRYTWKATNGRIRGNGPVGVWNRVIRYGQPKPGVVTVIASDGRGGKATAKFVF